MKLGRVMDNATVFEGVINAKSELEIQEYLRHYFLLRVFTSIKSKDKILKKAYQMFFDSGYRENIIYLNGSYTLYGWYQQIDSALTFEKERVLKDLEYRIGNLNNKDYRIWDAVDMAFGTEQYYKMQTLTKAQLQKLVVFFNSLYAEVVTLINNWVSLS